MAVNITIGNGNLGNALPNTDGVAGIILTGASEGSIVIGTPFLITTMNDVIQAGMTSDNNPYAYKQLQDLFNELTAQGVVSCMLYIMLVATTQTIALISDKTNANGAIKLLNFAAGSIRLLAAATDDTQVYNVDSPVSNTNGINADVYTAINNMQALGQQSFLQQAPFRAVLGGTSFSGTASGLTSQLTSANNRIGTVIGDTQSGAGAAVGITLGRLMAIPVQRKISRVLNGAISSLTAFIGTVSADQYDQQSVITSKGFITLQTIIGKAGFYFTGDPTCTAPTDDYDIIARGRIIDKAQIIAYNYFVNEQDDEVPVNTDGTLDAGYAKTLEQGIVNAINTNMTANGNIDSVTAYVDTTNNVQATGNINATLALTVPGYAGTINVKLGF
jgi:hypothetical protein